MLSLVSSQTLKEAEYVALSHRWGETVPGEVPSYCTNSENIDRRENGFLIGDLPATFRDAIEVTRQLDLQYLWIDSLCIIQGDKKDWEQEAGRMKDVYASAYCTIAATSASDSNSGFLKRATNSEYICVQDNFGRRVCVCSHPADFDTDIEGAGLNSRAWVMQERFLSCRTIHFGARQMYWECGEEVYCEDMTRLTARSTRADKYFRLDPEFPKRLHFMGAIPTINFLQSLLEDYSERGLSKVTDRAIALSGLSAHIATALGCEESYGYGTFNLYLHRSLLWMRTDLQKKKIQYEDGEEAPSWSWMAYEGGIRFISLAELPFQNLEVFKDIKFVSSAQGEKKVLRTKVWNLPRCYLNRDASVEGKSRILVSPGVEIGWIMPDGENFEMELAVVIGSVYSSESRDKGEYYILVVKEKEGENNSYERVGIGKIQYSYISRQDGDICLV
ncbi:het-domain-containing protein [Fusarium denticulatum]|uniref:Het-domain-containing protein n=1 Tax=Fusarium denticulatum TaxID=48507 RepID=A0A8H5UAQ3_9HYPO|nr:het-domain-containing protein [Fusarium denticulatum]